ncbi:hypothetical protein TNCV_5122221 [Trichonephila clavipes]|nr:hypothetical protein TNCV_5122221 [Trichonephila clavipes]
MWSSDDTNKADVFSLYLKTKLDLPAETKQGLQPPSVAKKDILHLLQISSIVRSIRIPLVGLTAALHGITYILDDQSSSLVASGAEWKVSGKQTLQEVVRCELFPLVVEETCIQTKKSMCRSCSIMGTLFGSCTRNVTGIGLCHITRPFQEWTEGDLSLVLDT